MSVGLPVSKVVKVTINLTPSAAQGLNFQTMLIVGDTNIIDVGQRMRTYSSDQQVAADFGTMAPEYFAATVYFGQSPQPQLLYIGRWAHTAVAGLNRGAILTTAQKAISVFQAVTTGSFGIAFDGGAVTQITGLNFSALANLNAVAAAITTALGTHGSCVWNGQQFVITSATSGATSGVSFATAGGTGTDVSAMLGLTNAAGATLVGGQIAESALTAVTILDGLPTFWYGLAMASTDIVAADIIAIAEFIEASGNPHFFFVTSQEQAALAAGDTTSIGAQLKALTLNRTATQYSSSSPYAAVSMAGRILTTDYTGNSTVITLMFKQEPGVSAETLTLGQSNALDANNYNYFTNYANNTAIIQNGVCASGQFIDVVIAADWFANALQTDLFNVFYTSTTKIPQTDAGAHILLTTAEADCEEAVNNGFLAPGIWNGPSFGAITTGQLLDKGYYVFAPPVASQSVAQLSARQAPPIQIAAVLAGAFHSVSIAATVAS
jgi:Protein of unknown function (DUF3383)